MHTVYNYIITFLLETAIGLSLRNIYINFIYTMQTSNENYDNYIYLFTIIFNTEYEKNSQTRYVAQP